MKLHSKKVNRKAALIRVMQTLKRSEYTLLEASEIQEILPDVAALQQRLQNFAQCPSNIAGIELSPHLKRILGMSECHGALTRQNQEYAVGHP